MSVTVEIVDGPVPVEQIAGDDSRNGAALRFLGVVRELESDRPLAALRYETYEPMALNELERLCNEALTRFGLGGVRLVHSRGVVPAGQPALLISMRSPHRKEALAAMDWLIDSLKRDVPIWKHPVFLQAHAEPGDQDA